MNKTFVGIACFIAISILLLSQAGLANYPGDNSSWYYTPQGTFSYVIGPYNNTFYYMQNHSGFGYVGYDGYEFESISSDTLIQYAIDNLTTTNGTVLIKSGSYFATVTLKDNVRLILDRGVSGITVNINAGATCDLEDYNSLIFKHYEAGTLTYIEDRATGYVLTSTANLTTIYVSFIDSLVSTTGVKILSLIVQNGTSFPTSPVDRQIFFHSTADLLFIYEGGAWVQLGAVDHGNLTGLNDDDHTIYLLASGGRALTGNWNIGGGFGIYGAVWLNSTNVSTDYLFLGALVADPGSPVQGQMWYNSVEDTVKYYNGSAIVIVPGIGGGSSSSYTLPYTYTIYKTGSTYYMEKYDGTIWSSTNASLVERAADGNTTNGIIFMRAGTYDVGSYGFYLDHTNKIVGEGPYATIFSKSENGNCITIEDINSASHPADWQINNVQIDMNSHTGHGIYGAYSGNSGTSSMPRISNVRVQEVAAGYAGICLLSPRMLMMDNIEVSTAGYGLYLGINVSAITHDGNSKFTKINVFTTADNAVGIYLTSGVTYILNIMQWSYTDVQDAPGHANTTGIWLNGVQETAWDLLNVEYFATGLHLAYNTPGTDGSDYNIFKQLHMYAIQTTCIDIDDGNYRNTFYGSYLRCDGAGDLLIDDDNALSTQPNRFYDFDFNQGTFDLTSGSVLYDSQNSAGAFYGYNHVSHANTTATTVEIDHGMAGTPTVYGISFNANEILSSEWMADATHVTITVTGTLPATWTAYVYEWYNP